VSNISQAEETPSLHRVYKKSNMKPKRKVRDSRAQCPALPHEPTTVSHEPSTPNSKLLRMKSQKRPKRKMKKAGFMMLPIRRMNTKETVLNVYITPTQTYQLVPTV
jgi:hypothetical protein